MEHFVLLRQRRLRWLSPLPVVMRLIAIGEVRVPSVAKAVYAGPLVMESLHSCQEPSPIGLDGFWQSRRAAKLITRPILPPWLRSTVITSDCDSASRRVTRAVNTRRQSFPASIPGYRYVNVFGYPCMCSGGNNSRDRVVCGMSAVA